MRPFIRVADVSGRPTLRSTTTSYLALTSRKLQGGSQKSKRLSPIIIKSYFNPTLWLDFSSISITKLVQECNKSVLNILCRP